MRLGLVGASRTYGSRLLVAPAARILARPGLCRGLSQAKGGDGAVSTEVKKESASGLVEAENPGEVQVKNWGSSVELQPVANLHRAELGAPAPAPLPLQPTLDLLVEKCRKRVEGYPDGENGFRGVLMKKPRGFAKVRVRGILWQARYFVLDHHPVRRRGAAFECACARNGRARSFLG